MGKKYIVKLDDNKLAYTAIIIDGVPYIKPLQLLPYTEPDLEQVRKEAYDKGFEDGKELCPVPEICHNNAYQKGLSDAWDVARKIQDTGGNLNWWIHNISATEAIEKIRQHEQEKEEIQVGDEVEAAFGKATVTEIKEKHVYYFYADGSYGFDEKEHVTKTGRRFPEIVEVLQKMKEEA